MELRQLRCVVAVAEELHFGRAAARLHMSQAPLSANIARTERELGHRLFHRTTRRVQLTSVGRELYERATRILELADGLGSDLDLVATGQAGRLRVGFVSSASYSLLPEAVRRFRVETPRLSVDLVPLTSAEQVDRLEEDALDLGLVRGRAGTRDLDVEPLHTEELVVCLPPGHRLAGRDAVRPELLADEPMIFFPTSAMPGFVAEIRPVFGGRSFPPVQHRVIQQETALGFVAAGMGFTVLPESVAAFTPAGVTLAGFDPPAHTTTYLARPRGDRSPAAARFEQLLRDSGRSTTAPRRRPGHGDRLTGVEPTP